MKSSSDPLGGWNMLRRESGIVQRVRARIRDVQHAAPLRVVVGYSGGADSLVLLAVLATLERTGEVDDLVAVHVNHGLRPEADVEAALAERVAGALNVPIVVREVDRGSLQRHRGVGLEEAARRERYLLLASAAREFGSGVLALGHHERDQAETVLMHLARGAGLRGAAGMHETNAIEVPWWTDDAAPISLTLWRPLLHEPYAEVQRVADLLRLPFVTDSSNEDRSFRRNALRHEVLPALDAAMPGAIAGLARFGALAAGDDDALASLAKSELANVRDGNALNRVALRALPVALQRRLLILWLIERCPEVEVSSDRIGAVVDALGGRSGAAIEVGAGWRVVIGREALTLRHG